MTAGPGVSTVQPAPLQSGMVTERTVVTQELPAVTTRTATRLRADSENTGMVDGFYLLGSTENKKGTCSQEMPCRLALGGAAIKVLEETQIPWHGSVVTNTGMAQAAVDVKKQGEKSIDASEFWHWSI